MRVVSLAFLVLLGCHTNDVERGAPPPVPSPVSTSATSEPAKVSPVASVPGAAAASVVAPPAPSAPSALPEPEGAPPLRRASAIERDRTTSGQQRMDAADRDKTGIVKQLFADAGVTWPPSQLLLRAFKQENRLEVWAAPKASGPLTHVTTYEICYASGVIGPKRQEGDRQVPEGFYGIVWFKAKSDYHMAMQVSYPNTSDRVLGHPQHPGGEIMIHGDCVSIGCLAMSDERIEELWVIGRAVPRTAIDVHIFPTRDMAGLVEKHADSPHGPFWLNLKEGFDRFEKNHERFNVRVKRDGRYEIFPR